MAKRKTIPKTLRFEVFKRDSFKCQYCGKQAPEVVLEIDHINPVANGGDNDILNLITSCFDCNRGKSAKTLDDNTVVSKQLEQLNALNEKREQLDMLVKWKKGLLDLDKKAIKSTVDYYKKVTGYELTEIGILNLSKLIKKYGISLVMDSIASSLETYGKYDSDGDLTKESVEKVFNMIGRVASVKAQGDNPIMKDLYYCRGILRNRLNYMDDRRALAYLKEAYELYCEREEWNHGLGADVDELKEICKSVRNWSEFRAFMNELGCGDGNKQDC